ncbi:Uncharacterised protein [Legionella spiritensis]|nr:Uncharacterised protein [Legionella spiritensis]
MRVRDDEKNLLTGEFGKNRLHLFADFKNLLGIVNDSFCF